jgi:hypothetical protein
MLTEEQATTKALNAEVAKESQFVDAYGMTNKMGMVSII